MEEFARTYTALTEVSTTNAFDRQVGYYLNGSACRNAEMTGSGPTVFVVDDDANTREAIHDILKEHGYAVASFADGPAFFRAHQATHHGCLLIDALMPGMSGITLLGMLKTKGIALPVIMMAANPPLCIAVQAMKAGAVDFIEKPLGSELLLAAVATALKQAADVISRLDYREEAARRVGSLTKRQHEILTLVIAGHPSKNIAADLHLSQRTVDNHRAAIARKTCSKSLPALIKTAICARCSIQAQSQRQLADIFPLRLARENGVLH